MDKNRQGLLQQSLQNLYNSAGNLAGKAINQTFNSIPSVRQYNQLQQTLNTPKVQSVIKPKIDHIYNGFQTAIKTAKPFAQVVGINAPKFNFNVTPVKYDSLQNFTREVSRQVLKTPLPLSPNLTFNDLNPSNYQTPVIGMIRNFNAELRKPQMQKEEEAYKILNKYGYRGNFDVNSWMNPVSTFPLINQNEISRMTPQEQKVINEAIKIDAEKQINVATNIGGGTQDLSKAAFYLRSKLDKQSANILKEFASRVEITGGNRAMPKDLALNAQAIIKDAFGTNAQNWSNMKMKNVIDLVLQRVGGMKNNAGLGLSVGDIRQGSIAQRLDNLPPIRTTNRKGSYTNLREVDNPLLDLAQKRDTGYNKAFQSINDPQDLESTVTKFIPNVRNKVGVIDYLRTPDRVLEKIGLGNHAKFIRRQHDAYIDELPKQLQVITEWSERVPGSARTIFRYLDGQSQELSNEEMKVAQEIKGYLSRWADRLELPKDSRISNYITHIFEKDFIQKEFDPEIAKLIKDRVAGSVYDPFVENRIGKQGYIEDVWQSLDAYVKRATRKVHMDPALQSISEAAEKLEDSQYTYVKRYISNINMRPTELDNLIDTSIKTLVGYKFGQRPVALLSRKARQMVYRATLGLNPGSALRNLSQGSNTYAKLGEKYTVIGYTNMIKNAMAGSDELQKAGVLADNIVQDRTINATRKMWEKLDKGLFIFFDTAEKINRGAAYYGGKAKALSKGMSEADAIEFGKQVVRDTQFTFGSVDTPVVLQSDVAKTLAQFQSYTLKQGEFLTEMIKNKDLAGGIRYAASSMLFILTIGKLIGMKPENVLPAFRFDTPPTLQLPVEMLKSGLNLPDEYGNEVPTIDKAVNILEKGGLFVPGYTQGKKTVQGLTAFAKGYDESKTGRVKFPIEQSVGNFTKAALFGKYNLPEAQEYRNEERTILGQDQSEEFKAAKDKSNYYQSTMDKRKNDDQDEEYKSRLKEMDDSFIKTDDKIYIKSLSGDVKIFDREAVISKPVMTGNPNIDRKMVEQYRDDISKRMNEVYEAAGVGAVEERVALEQINQFLQVHNTVSQALATKKVTQRSIEDLLYAKEQSAIDSEVAQVTKLYKDGKLPINEAEKLLSDLLKEKETLKLFKPSKARIRKGRKIKLKKIKMPKSKKLKIKTIKPLKFKSLIKPKYKKVSTKLG